MKNLLYPILLGIAAAAQAQDNAMDQIWESQICNNAYFDGLGIATPWEPNNRLGIDLGQTPCMDFRNDWELYHRKISAADVALAKTGTASQANVYFSFYNRRVGVMRTFLWIKPLSAGEGTSFSVNIKLADGGQNRYWDHTLFSYDGGGKAFSTAERLDPNKNADRIYFTHSHADNHWIVQDSYLSYDYVAHGDKLLFLDYDVQTHSKSEVTLTGTIKPEIDAVVQAGLVSTAINLGKKTAAGFSSAKSAYPDITSGVRMAGNLLTDYGNAKAGDDLVKLAAKAAAYKPGASGLGTLYAGYTLIDGILGWLGGSQTGFSPQLVNLNGSISSVSGVAVVQIPLANCNFNEANQPLWSKYHPTAPDKNLGLYQLTQNPRVNLYYMDQYTGTRASDGAYLWTRKFYASIEDPFCLTKVNPATGAILKETKIKFDAVVTQESNPDLKISTEFFPSSEWSATKKALIGTQYVKSYGASSSAIRAPGFTKITLKISNLLDVGRGGFFESVNCYAPGAVKASRVTALPAARDFPTCLAPNPIGEAVDLPTYAFKGGTGPNWYALQSGIYGAVNNSAAVSGKIGDNETTTLETIFLGSTVSFAYMAETEGQYDAMTFYIDGAARGDYSGQTGWNWTQFTVPSGKHTVKWVYHKDGSISIGQDRVMLDHIEFR